MKESTLVINHLAAPSAPTNAHKKHIWFHMNKFTLMKNHWAVRFFQRNSVYFIAWRLMKKPFSCSKCDKQFTQVGHLQTHERIHTDEKPFGCSKCDKKFTQASHLKTHERVHANEKEEIHHIKCFEETWTNWRIIHAEAWGIIHSLYIYLHYKCFGKLVFRTFLCT